MSDNTADLEGEIWKPVYDSTVYFVSNMGRLKSLKCGNTRIMVLSDRRGSRVSNVKIDGKTKSVIMHILVLTTFIGPPPKGKMYARHLNGDKDDNRLENLVWSEHKDCYYTRTRTPNWRDVPMRERKPHHNSKLTVDDVLYIRSSSETNQALADKFGVRIRNIFAIKSKQSWKWVK